MMNFSLFLDIILSIPKSLYFNFYNFPLRDALHFPVLVSWKTKLGDISGEIILPEIICFGLVKFGFSGSFNMGGGSYFQNKGKIIFKGKSTFSRGTQLIVGENGSLKIGVNFRCNTDCIFNAGNYIEIGDDCLLSWNIMILDGDGHDIYTQDCIHNTSKKTIKIGTHVWICANSMILKGTSIQDNSVIGAGSIVSKRISENNVLIAGNNFIVKKNINWND